MFGRVLILALCVVGAFSVPTLKAKSSLNESQVDSIVNVLQKIEGIVNIHSAKSATGVVNWPVVEAVAEKVAGILTSLQGRSSLSQSQIDSIASVLEKIEDVVQIHSIQTRSLTESQLESVLDTLNKIEGIINIHSAKSDTGVVNWPVVQAVADKVAGILNSLQSRSSLSQSQIDSIASALEKIEGIVNIHSLNTRTSLSESQIDNIINILQKIEDVVQIHSIQTRSLSNSQVDSILEALDKIEGIINIHSAKSIPDTGVINWPVVEYVIEKIESILTKVRSTSTLTPEQIENIWKILNEIEGIINIHAMPIEPKSSVDTASVIDILQKIEDVVQIH